jgi:hypothetical protein
MNMLGDKHESLIHATFRISSKFNFWLLTTFEDLKLEKPMIVPSLRNMQCYYIKFCGIDM